MPATVLPFVPAHGLLPSEVAAARAWARRYRLPLEAGATEEGGTFVTLDLGAALGIPPGHAAWSVTREGRCLAAFDGNGAKLAGGPERTLRDVLDALAANLPRAARHDEAGP